MKIIKIHDDINQSAQRDMDLLCLDVEYNSGDIGRVYLYRANVKLMVKKIEILNKYNIPEGEIDELLDLAVYSYNADHFYDKDVE